MPDEGGRSGDVSPLGISPRGCLAGSPYFSLVCRSISSQLTGPAGDGSAAGWRLDGCHGARVGVAARTEAFDGRSRPDSGMAAFRAVTNRSPATIQLPESHRNGRLLFPLPVDFPIVELLSQDNRYTFPLTHVFALRSFLA